MTENSCPHEDNPRHNRAVSDELHPAVYVCMVGLGLWYVLSAWIGFATDSYTAYLLAVVSGLFFVAIVIPCAIWLASRKGRDPDESSRGGALRGWASGDFKIWQGQLKASSAAIQILLPMAAVAFGMTTFAIVARSIELGLI